MNTEGVSQIRDTISAEIKNSRNETKVSYLNTRRKDLGDLAIKSKIPALHTFQNLCTRFAKDKRADDLQKICLSLPSGNKYVTSFMKTDGALYALVGYLTGINTKYQLESTKAIINIACGSTEECIRISQKVGVYLITNIHSDISEYQNLSAWAMGNLCCQNEIVSQLSKSQGLEGALLSLLSSQNTDVLRSACYALDNYMRTLPSRIEDIGALKADLLFEIFDSRDEYLAEIAWCLFIFSTSSNICCVLISHNIVAIVLKCLTYLRTENIMDLSLTTACVRILTNCIAESIEVSFQICSNIEHFATVCNFIRNLPFYHLRKELKQCIANIFNMLVGHEEGQSVLARNKFYHYMEPVLQHLENSAYLK